MFDTCFSYCVRRLISIGKMVFTQKMTKVIPTDNALNWIVDLSNVLSVDFKFLLMFLCRIFRPRTIPNPIPMRTKVRKKVIRRVVYFSHLVADKFFQRMSVGSGASFIEKLILSFGPFGMCLFLPNEIILFHSVSGRAYFSSITSRVSFV